MTRLSFWTSAGRAFGDLHPVIEHADPVGNAHHHPHGMLDQQDGDAALVAHAANEIHHVAALARDSCRPSARRAASSRGRVASARADLEPALFAIGEVARHHVAAPPEADEVEDVGRFLMRMRLVAPGCGQVLNTAPNQVDFRWICMPTRMFSKRRQIAEQADILIGAVDAGARPPGRA